MKSFSSILGQGPGKFAWCAIGAVCLAAALYGALGPRSARAEQLKGAPATVTPNEVSAETQRDSAPMRLFRQTGLYAFVQGFLDLGRSEDSRLTQGEADATLLPLGAARIVMILVGLILIYLAIGKGFEPLLLLPIGFGGILANIPVADIAGPEGMLGILYSFGVETGLFPLFIFMGVGAMTDFGPLIANPKMALLGGAAQIGIFCTLLGALALSQLTGGLLSFDLRDAASIGIIGGADGPTAIFISRKLSPDLLGAIAVAAYSYMALVPIIQPPIMRLLTTEAERKIKMKQLRKVGRLEKIVFPLVVLLLCIVVLPDATPLLGSLMFGNLVRESGVVERLSKTLQNEFVNIVTILLGLSVGGKLSAEKFLRAETLGILALGAVAFCLGTAGGTLMGKLMSKLSKEPLNPLIGAAGVSAVPMAARVVNSVGLEANKQNFLLMHAMGPNVAGVIGSAIVAGVLLALVQ